MIEQYYVRPDTVDRIRTSWIFSEIEQYVSWLTKNQYSSRSVLRRIPLLVAFGEYAKEHGATEIKDLPDYVEPYVEGWVTQRDKRKSKNAARKKRGDCIRNPIRQMLRLVVPGYIGRCRPRMPDNPFEAQAPKFLLYLIEEKGLRPNSVRQYQFHLRQFASYLRRIESAKLASLSPGILSGFITEYGPRVAWPTLRNACGTLRVFLRYLHREGVLAKDLSAVIEFPQSYRLSGVPRSIAWTEVEHVLAGIDRRTSCGKRDYAMLLLLATYGLRACEVAALTLDDIDWRNDRIKIRERKAGNSTAYPLSSVAGAAIVDYLKNGRQASPERQVFLRAMAPPVPITSAAISCRAIYYLHKAGIDVPRPGSHTFRHSCVQRLINSDFTLKQIGDFVGHRNASSTQIYSKVAIEALRQVALGDGEEVL